MCQALCPVTTCVGLYHIWKGGTESIISGQRNNRSRIEFISNQEWTNKTITIKSEERSKRNQIGLSPLTQLEPFTFRRYRMETMKNEHTDGEELRTKVVDRNFLSSLWCSLQPSPALKSHDPCLCLQIILRPQCRLLTFCKLTSYRGTGHKFCGLLRGWGQQTFLVEPTKLMPCTSVEPSPTYDYKENKISS